MTLATAPRLDSLSDLLDRYRSGWSLPQPFYVDDAIFDIDMKAVFSNHWSVCGHISQLPNPGDYMLFDLGDESIIIVRDHNDEIRAYFNVCTHRGAPVCSKKKGNCKRFVCPYHAWTFDLDGQLCRARTMPDDFNPDEFALRECSLQLLEGIILVCPGSDPFDLTEPCKELATYLAPYDLPNTEIGHQQTYSVNSNWKLLIENFNECYHCAPAHPQFCQVMAYGTANETPALRKKHDDFMASWDKQMEAEGKLTGGVDRPEDGVHFCRRTPIRPGFLTQSQDGQPVAPLLGKLDGYDGGVTGATIWPTCWIAASCDHVTLLGFIPREPQRTEVHAKWLVRKGAVKGTDYQPERVSWLWSTTGAQDWELCEQVQRGVKSQSYVPGPYHAEVGVKNFVDWYIQQLHIYQAAQ